MSSIILSLSPFLYLSRVSSLKGVLSVKSQSSTNLINSSALGLLCPSLSYIKLYMLKLRIIITLP